MLESELGAVSYVKNTGKPARRVFDHIGQRLFFPAIIKNFTDSTCYPNSLLQNCES